MGKGLVPMMSDERILGQSDFVTAVLSQAHEGYEQRNYPLLHISLLEPYIVFKGSYNSKNVC